MKTLVLFCLSLAVALGVPVLHPGEEQTFIEENQSPLVGDQLPAQGHVVVENPAPQAVLSLEEHQEKVSPVKMKQSEKTAELEVEVKPEVKEDQELKAEVKLEPEVKVKQAEQEVQVDKEAEPQQEVSVEAEAKMEQQPEMDPELQAEPDFKVDAEAGEEEAKPEMKVGEEFGAEEEVEPQPEVPVEVEAEVMEPELQAEPDFKVESEIKVEPDVQMELEPEEEPLLTEAQEKSEVQMSLESEIYPGQVTEERHIDMEGKYEAMGEPYMELEPLNDDDDDDNLPGDEARQDAAFQRQSPVAEALTQEEEELMRERNDVFSEETIMEMEPEIFEEPLQNQDVVPYAADLEEEAALDMAGQQMSLSESYFPEEEAGMEMTYEKQEDPMEEEEYLMMLEEARTETTREEKDNEKWRPCPGVLLEKKCYQFFKAPKSAADAEFVCQWLFPKGHLAAITNHRTHRELMNLILKENGNYTNTWVGGIRYLNTNRFVWLDGSHWSYADWLLGEPDNRSGVEDCLEVQALGNGKFNDFTCWQPQPFICSYTYQ